MAWKADPPEAVVFDAFGTLITAVPGKDGAYQTLARDVAAEPIDFRRSALTCPASLHEFAFSLGASDPAKYQRMLESELEGCTLYDDVRDTLAFLRATGVRYAVCSNLASGYGGKVRELVPGAEAYVFSYETGLVKPESGIYGACCEALGLPPEKIAFIGDTPSMDFQGPTAAGMRAALVTRKAGDGLLAAISRLPRTPTAPASLPGHGAS